MCVSDGWQQEASHPTFSQFYDPTIEALQYSRAENSPLSIRAARLQMRREVKCSGLDKTEQVFREN